MASAEAVSIPRASRASDLAQAGYYAGWLAVLVAESFAWAALGLVLGFVVFTAGGVMWAASTAAHIHPGAPVRGPILRATLWMFDAGGPWHLGAVLLGGAPGVAVSAAAAGRGDSRRLALWSSIVYSGIFAVFHLLRPDAGVPAEWAPIGFR